MPSLVLIDGGLGQLHAAAAALEEIGLTTQPLASIAKREEIIYVHGQEDDPVVLDRRSPVLHVIQKIRDESHRFAVSYHRKRREMRDRVSELDEIPGVGRACASYPALEADRATALGRKFMSLRRSSPRNPESHGSSRKQASPYPGEDHAGGKCIGQDTSIAIPKPQPK